VSRGFPVLSCTGGGLFIRGGMILGRIPAQGTYLQACPGGMGSAPGFPAKLPSFLTSEFRTLDPSADRLGSFFFAAGVRLSGPCSRLDMGR